MTNQILESLINQLLSEEDDGSWILKLIDLSGLEKWSDEDKNAAIEMIKRNANVFSQE